MLVWRASKKPRAKIHGKRWRCLPRGRSLDGASTSQADERGFSLIEVMVALSVLAIAFTALLGLHARTLEIAGNERAHGEALLLARTMLAEVEITGIGGPGEESGDFEASHPGRYPGWAWRRVVSPTPIPGALIVSVQVVPSNGAGTAVQLELVLRGTAGGA